MKKKYPFISFLIILMTHVSCDNNREIIIKDDCIGTICTIYKDLNNHNVYVFNIKSNGEERNFIADFFPESWKYATLGDSIIKKAGDSFITIKKKDGTSKIFETRVK